MTGQSLFLFSILSYSFLIGFFALFTLRSSEANIQAREKACRKKISGVLMAFIALIWCARHGQSIFPGERIADYFIPLALLFTLLSYFLLDYLATRAFAALLILIAHYHLYWIFALHTPFASLSSLACFITGTAGIVFAGKPCLLRDFFRKAAKNNRFKRYSVFILLAISFIYFFTGIYLIVNNNL